VATTGSVAQSELARTSVLTTAINHVAVGVAMGQIRRRIRRFDQAGARAGIDGRDSHSNRSIVSHEDLCGAPPECVTGCYSMLQGVSGREPGKRLLLWSGFEPLRSSKLDVANRSAERKCRATNAFTPPRRLTPFPLSPFPYYRSRNRCPAF
jgi:hypothetical protein